MREKRRGREAGGRTSRRGGAGAIAGAVVMGVPAWVKGAEARLARPSKVVPPPRNRVVKTQQAKGLIGGAATPPAAGTGERFIVIRAISALKAA